MSILKSEKYSFFEQRYVDYKPSVSHDIDIQFLFEK